MDAANLATAGGDMSIVGLFLQADLVVKAVLVLLLLASVWVWAIVFEKITTLRRANRAADGFEDRFWSGGSLDEMYENEGAKPVHPLAAVFGAAMGEWKRSARVAGADMSRGSVRDRVDRTVTVAQGAPPSATLEPCFLVHLDIHPENVHSITDALNAFTSPETITGMLQAFALPKRHT